MRFVVKFFEISENSCMKNLDELDKRIIEILQEEGDITHAALAERANSTASTCLRRTARLRELGVLTGSIYLADAAKLGRGLQAVITVTTKEQPRREREIFAEKLNAEPAVRFAYGVTGELDAVIIAHFRDMNEYQTMCDRLFDSLDSVVRYTTHFVAETYKQRWSISCDALP